MKKILSLALVFFGFISSCFATHIWGSEINYRPLSTGSSKYEISVKYYRYCGGVAVTASSFTVKIRCANASASTQLSMNLASIRDVTSLSAISGECTPTNTYGTGQGLEEHTYLDTVDFGTAPFNAYASCGETRIELEACCRNSTINTGAGNANYHNYASIFFSNFSENTSSSASLQPLWKAMVYKPVRYYNKQNNPDGDSLSFALVNPLSAANTTINYSSGFAADIPVQMYYFGSFSYPYSNPNFSTPIGSYFNKNNGDWIFTPAGANNISVYVVEVTEWRKDANDSMRKVGVTRKDMTFEISNFGNYQLFENIANSGHSCIGENSKFTFEAKDNITTAVAPKNADSLVVEVISDYPVYYQLDSTKLNAGTRIFGSLNWNTDSFTSVPPSFDVIIRLHSGKLFYLPLFDSRRITINNYPRPSLETSINKLNCGMVEVSASIDTFNNNESIVSYEVSNTNGSVLKSGFISSAQPKDTFQLNVAGTYYIGTTSSYALVCETTVMDTLVLSSNDVYPLPQDTAYLACYTNQQILNVDPKWMQAIWSTGDTAHSISVDKDGTYKVSLLDSCGNEFDHQFIVEFRSYHPALDDTIICVNLPVNYTLNPLTKMSWIWPNGGNTKTYTATTSGLKILQLYDSLCNYTFTDSFSIAYKNKPVANIPKASEVRCDDRNVKAEAVYDPTYTYLWSNGSDSSSSIIKNQGWYTVTVSNECGNSKDSIFIIQRFSPDIDLGKDVILCTGDSTSIGVNYNVNYTYLWNDGVANFTRVVKTENQYILSATNGCGTTPDTIDVYVIDAPNVDLGPDTAIWEFDIINLKNRTPSRFATYKWSIGSESDNLDVRLAGTYWLDETNKCGTDRDSIKVRYKVGVNELAKLGIKVFPNPAKNVLYIQSQNGEAATIGIYSILGEKVLEKQMEGVQNTLDISEIAQGTYILRIEQGQNLVSQSILVE
ncbi:MAG: hypothetical protein RLZZ337_1997 [Bacteroidota bacterium]|jgi:hypothetical protein